MNDGGRSTNRGVSTPDGGEGTDRDRSMNGKR